MRVKSMYKQVCSLIKSTMFRSKSTLYNILFYLVVYLLISLKGNVYTMCFCLGFRPSCLFPLNRQTSTFKIYCALFTITSNGSAVIHVVCGHEYYVNTLSHIDENVIDIYLTSLSRMTKNQIRTK